MEAFIEQRKRDGQKKTDYLRAKRKPMTSLKPNEMQCSRELPATRRQVVSNKKPVR